MAISCDRALELISAGLDGALTEGERQLLEAHLAGCGACRALQADFVSMETAFEDLRAVPPEGLIPGVLSRIGEEKVVSLSARRWKRWAAAAAVFAVVLLGAGALGTLRNGTSAAPAPMSVAAGPEQPAAVFSRSASGGAEDAAVQSAMERMAQYLGFDGVRWEDGAAAVPDGPDGAAALIFDGLSENGACARFRLETAEHTAYYEVPLDGGEILRVPAP